MKKKMSFAAGGDALIMKHLPEGYEGFLEIADFINQAEAKATNLETTISHGDLYGSAFSGGTWLTAEPGVINDLKQFGFNLFGWANNHTLDFAYEGVLSTKKALDQAQVVHGGAGANLHQASKPGIIDLPSGRVAMISICSTFDPSARAGAQTDSMPGRPGLNPLRYTNVYTVSPKQMETLKEIADETHLNFRKNTSIKQGFLKPAPEGFFDFLDLRFCEDKTGDQPRKYTLLNKTDLERTLNTIKDALLVCDYCMVMVHSHEVKAERQDQADYFMEEFSRACIDAGACAILGGGTHQLKGIELYKGKPIFYSLGNFIFQNEYAGLLPADYMEKHGLPMNTPAATAIEARSASATGVGMHSLKDNFRSVIPYFEMEDDTCKKILLKPIELGLEGPTYFRNLPHPAKGKIADEIFEYLIEANQPYHTKMRKREDGLFEIEL